MEETKLFLSNATEIVALLIPLVGIGLFITFGLYYSYQHYKDINESR